MPINDDPLWYKDAVIYQVHVKSFFDANNDGVGDFKGLTQKLDYIKNLGATCIWLLPFYPSPLRDDGYDIADYRGVNPAYGTLRDFREFVRQAHERGIRVMIELVVNHTSDQHPWFVRARAAKRGSVYRNFYVWSDTDQRYTDARIIFTDTETSNWTWDPVAAQYYWHRFFSHQPDLNYDNPRVVAAVLDVMRFWLDMGVDGMRLDAVPYLCEREGTSCENLPETHAVLKHLRAVLDSEYPNRIFLAEANQWPEDVRAYFGDGDECHMAFHFPLMPRMFMAIAEEDRYPIIDIMRQTPDIPPLCQWAIFLRNHDEMTLEMVTDQERDYMYRVYATEPRARINIGIRRRLAPLMENDRRRIELLAGLLMSMPGTPIFYYGDEIGMGDNIYLNDRDGVRTPMQWSVDRNGGFSRADPARLFLAPIMDPVYGFQSVNVEAQSASPSSLINWLRKLIAVRQGYRVFGRGTLRFVTPVNRRVIAYIREYEDQTVLCVANLSRNPQQAALDLSAYSGRVPVEMIGWSPFATVGEDRYVITLPGHGFFWFLLSRTAQAPAWEVPLPDQLPELVTLVLPREETHAQLVSTAVGLLENDVLPAFLPNQRWFADKDAALGRIALLDAVALGTNGALAANSAPASRAQAYSAIIELPDAQRAYFLPLVIARPRAARCP
jgi:maltose alpha-D-glucosyltransferase/alpha-amylase